MIDHSASARQSKEVEDLRAEVEALKRELEETKKSTTQYLQNVAHQLTAPLGAIKWSIEALKDHGVPIQRKGKLLSSIYSQGTILVHLIKNFSLMSNLEADHELGQFREKPEKVDPLRLAINLANDFQPQAGEGGKKIHVNEESFDEVFDGGVLLVVKNLIAQALSNLLENAVKYSNLRTAIWIEAIFVKYDDEIEAWPAISVRNIGLAISSHEIKQLHNRGFRGSTAKQKIPAGTGIGLYIAKRIMDLHEGNVIVKANGSETNVMLRFPNSRVQ